MEMLMDTNRQAHQYKLEVLQQPLRARMCGLGDKDRRQISPPPCIKLSLYDEFGQEINVDECDISQLILIAELYSADESRNLSIVKSMNNSVINDIESFNSQSSIISSASSSSDNSPKFQPKNDLDSHMTYINQSDSKKTSPIRNLIGCVVTNAFKLYNEKKEKGIWFIMQDLSIRIEGDFKIKFSLFNIQSLMNEDFMMDSSYTEEFESLSSVFSDSFKVYSAKKFPGVTESSELSKIFASQGVKIPIRRDAKDRDEDD